MSTDFDERDLARLLMPTWRALLDIETQRCAEHDLAHWHYIVLADILEHPGTSQSQLAQRIVRSPSRLATDIEFLTSKQLVHRSSASHDRRVHQLNLTREGNDLALRVRRSIRNDEEHLLQRLSAAEMSQLRNLLARALDPATL